MRRINVKQIQIQTLRIIFELCGAEIRVNLNPHLARLLRIGSIKIDGLQKVFAVPVERHRGVRHASADRLHHGDSFLGRVNPENRWLALAL